MTQGRISYLEFEHVIVGLGGGDDVFGIDSTHAGTTVVNAGAGDDRLTIETVSGATAVNAEAGDDLILVNAHVPAVGEPLEPQAITAPLALDGGAGADATTINLFGNGDAAIAVLDSIVDGASNRLTINATRFADTFLLRAGLIALLSSPGNGAGLPYEVWNRAERITYGPEINAGVMLNLGAGDDRVAFDDTSALLTVNGEDGDDTLPDRPAGRQPARLRRPLHRAGAAGDHARAADQRRLPGRRRSTAAAATTASRSSATARPWPSTASRATTRSSSARSSPSTSRRRSTPARAATSSSTS